MRGMFDAQKLIEGLQEAVRFHDVPAVQEAVSDQMIWVMPEQDNNRGKHEWIEASCSVTWNWFEVEVRRVVEVGDDTRVVESWISQSREPVEGEDARGPVTASGVVLDVWARERDIWRLITRHPQRSEDA